MGALFGWFFEKISKCLLFGLKRILISEVVSIIFKSQHLRFQCMAVYNHQVMIDGPSAFKFVDIEFDYASFH